MKILFIHHGEVSGGAPTSLAYTINELKKMKPNYTFKVLCVNKLMSDFFIDKCKIETAIMPNPLKETGKILIGWTPFFYWDAIKTLIKEVRYIRGRIKDFEAILKFEKPDKVHLNSGSLFVPAIAAKRCSIPILWHIREVFGGGKWNLRRIIVGKWIQSIAEIVFTISDVEKVSIQGQKSQKVKTVYNFVDIQTFKPNQSIVEIKKKLSIPLSDIFFISLGGAAPRKGLVEIIKSLNYLSSNIHFVIAGPTIEDLSAQVKLKIKLLLFLEDVLYLSRLRSFKFSNYIDRCRLAFQSLKRNQRNIHFIGQINDVPNYINASNGLIFAGVTPHFPRPVYEAWLCKKPVFVFNVNGISSEVDAEVNGVVVERRSSKMLAKAINQNMSNISLMDRLGQNGYEKSINKFDSVKNVKLLEPHF